MRRHFAFVVAHGQAATPVRLTELHEGAWRACVAGPQLVWDDGTPTEARLFDSRLRAFAAATGLAFVEFIITSGETPRIVDVDARPRFGLFGEAAKRAIADGLAEALARGIGVPCCVGVVSRELP